MAEQASVIVVGVDGSPSSLKALEWAARHAQVTSMPVEAIATWQYPSNYGYAMAFESDFDPSAGARDALDVALTPMKEKYPDVEFRANAVEGETRNVLVSRSKTAELLVLGSRGHGELTGMLLGSVSGYCVTHAHCPVLVTRS